MEKIDTVADFLYLHMKNQLQDNEFVRLITGYKSSIAMYNHLNQAQKGLLSALTNKESIDTVWAEAAKLASWLARIADLHEKEIDRAGDLLIKHHDSLPVENELITPTSP